MCVYVLFRPSVFHFIAIDTSAGTTNLRPDELPFRVYNIFHPNDPVAMRMEPVVHDRFTTIPPVVLPYWWTMDKTQNAMKVGNPAQGKKRDVLWFFHSVHDCRRMLGLFVAQNGRGDILS